MTILWGSETEKREGAERRKSGGGFDRSLDALLLCSGDPEAGVNVGEDSVAAFDLG
jgi:hypothetical protein